MTDAFKELVKNAPIRRKGYFDRFMFASNGIYDGFWGKNGYDNIIVLARAVDDKTWYKLSRDVDVFQVFKLNHGLISVDIPTEYGVPSLFFDKPLHIDFNGMTSALTAYYSDN